MTRSIMASLNNLTENDSLSDSCEKIIVQLTQIILELGTSTDEMRKLLQFIQVVRD